MTPDLLAELARYPAFPPSAATLIGVGGIEAAAKLIAAWPGQDVPMPVYPGGVGDAGKRLWRRLVNLIGEDAAEKLVLHFAGDDMHVPNLKIVLQQRTAEQIRAEFDRMVAGGAMSGREAVFELGARYHLSRRAVEAILKKPSINVAPQPVEQIAGRAKKKIVMKPIDDAQGCLF